MKKLFSMILVLGLLLSGNAYAEIIKFENCFNVKDTRKYTGFFKELWKPTTSFNKASFDYWEILVDLNTFESITNYQFSKNAHKNFSNLPRKISRHMFNTKKYNYQVNTDEQTGEIYYSRSFNDTYWGTKKDKYNQKLISLGYDWSDVYSYSIFDLTNGIIENKSAAFEEPERFTITKCASKVKSFNTGVSSFYNFQSTSIVNNSDNRLYYDKTTDKMKECLYEVINGYCSAFAPYKLSSYDANTLFYNKAADSMQKCLKHTFGKCTNFLPQIGIKKSNQLFYNKRTKSMTTCLNSNNQGKCLAFGQPPLKRNKKSSGSYIVDSALNPYYKKVPNPDQLLELGLRMLSGACTLGRDC